MLSRLLDMGVSGQSPVEVRRVRTINVVAVVVTLVNLAYNLAFLMLSWLGIINFGDVGPVVLTNSVSILGTAAALVLNGMQRTDVAMWVLFLAGIFNLSWAVLLLGQELGFQLFLPTVPATIVLVTRSGDLRAQLTLLTITVVSFAGVMLAGTATPPSLAETAVAPIILVANALAAFLLIGGIAIYFRHLVDTAEAELRLEKERSERLLLNILPEEIADRLKAGEEPIADRVDDVSILFADLVDSTPMSEQLPADRMVELLNEIFSPFDDLAEELGLEKIKTIGDAYMVVSGLPEPRTDHLEALAKMALGMRDEISKHSVEGFGNLQMRYGIHTGSVVAGVIGKRKFSYDLWGDTVNTAARMESHGLAGEIQVTDAVRRQLNGTYRFEKRGEIDIKGKGSMTTYFLEPSQPDRI